MSHNDMPFSEQLDSVGSKVTAVYAPVVENLQQVRSLARAFETGIERLNPDSADTPIDAPETADIHPDGDMQSAARALRNTIAAAVAGIENSVIHDEMRSLRVSCTRLDKNGRELSALSFLMLVTAPNNVASRLSVELLVKELRDLSESLRSESDGIVNALEQIGKVRKTSVASLNNALALVDAHLEGCTDITDDHASADAQDGALNALRRMARALSGEIGRRMPGIVACMQHPDAFAQRCDHMARAAEYLEGQAAGTPLSRRLHTLISAQVSDMRDELSEIQTNAIASLDGIRASSRETSVAFADGLNKDQRLERIAERRAELEATHEVMQRIRDVADGSLRDLETCFQLFEGVAGTFDRLNRMRKTVRLSALNADLSERQSEINTPELRSVTKAVGECATHCGTTIAALNGSFTKINSAFASVDSQSLGQAIAEVVAHLDCAKTEMTRLAENVGHIQEASRSCAGTLDDLVSNAGAASSRIEANALSLRWLDQIAETAAHTMPEASGEAGASSDIEVLEAIFSSYSIARERDVHCRSLGETKTPHADSGAVMTDADDDDPLASVLF